MERLHHLNDAISWSPQVYAQKYFTTKCIGIMSSISIFLRVCLLENIALPSFSGCVVWLATIFKCETRYVWRRSRILFVFGKCDYNIKEY